MMTMKEAAEILEIKSYPAEFDQLAKELSSDPAPACDPQLIERLQTRLGLFLDYYDLVLDCAKKLNEMEAESLYVKVASHWAKTMPFVVKSKLQMPAFTSPVRDFLPLMILINQMEDAIAQYRARGFSEKEVADIYWSFGESLGIEEMLEGRPGIFQGYYSWLNLYTSCRIYFCKGLNYETKILPDGAVFLRHRETGEILPLVQQGTYHRSGLQPLGNIGYEDEEGSFKVSFSEDPHSFYGYPCRNNVVSNTPEFFLKSEWCVACRPGDEIISFHIPRDTDISPEKLDDSMKTALRWMRERFPEFHPKAIWCTSWLMSPDLKELTGADSKMTGMMERFVKHPRKNSGNDVFSYVFHHDDPHDFPNLSEKTTLQRKLKAKLLRGERIFAASGIIPIDD